MMPACFFDSVHSRRPRYGSTSAAPECVTLDSSTQGMISVEVERSGHLSSAMLPFRRCPTMFLLYKTGSAEQSLLSRAVSLHPRTQVPTISQ